MTDITIEQGQSIWVTTRDRVSGKQRRTRHVMPNDFEKTSFTIRATIDTNIQIVTLFTLMNNLVVHGYDCNNYVPILSLDS